MSEQRAGQLTGGVRPEDYRPAPLRPLETAQELKQATVRDYSVAMQRAGVPVDSAAVERIARDHLQLVDRLREQEAQPPASPSPAPRRDLAAEAVAADPDSGIKVRKAANPERHALLHGRGKPDDRMAHARARIKRILEGMTPVVIKTSRGAELNRKASMMTAQIPALAERYFELWGNFLQRHRASRHNPFFGLSDADALRMFEVEVYRICDASTGRLGQWWVPR